MLDSRESHAVHEQSADPVIMALRAEREARRAYVDALDALERAGAFTEAPQIEEGSDFQRDNLQNSELAEAKYAALLTKAEIVVLETKPTSLEGSAALLHFLQKQMSDWPGMAQISEAIGNVEATLREILKAS